MFDTNHQNSPCAFAEALVSYLYEETGDGRAAFEAHLKTCADCADELAGFGSIRASISDWRTAEFSTLATPQIEIPRAIKKGVKIADFSVQSKSWLDKLRETFAFSPAWAAAAALLFVTVCAGLFALVHNFSGGAQVAETDSKNNLQTNVSTTAQNNSDLASKVFANENVNQNSPEKLVSPGVLKIKQMPPQNSQVASANNSAAKISNETRLASNVKSAAPKLAGAPIVRRLENSNPAVAQAKPSAAKTGKLPQLNSIEDDDDDEEMLLLADLVDEAGRK